MSCKRSHCYKVILIVVLAFFWGCSASNTQPVSLPVPFSGALTADTQILIAEGRSVSPTTTALKSQTDSSGITWNLFDASTGIPHGSVTFFPNTQTAPEMTPYTAGATSSVRRIYKMKVCANVDSETEVCSSDAEFFEYPTEYSPSFTATSGDPVVRVMIFSGRIDSGQGAFTMGELIDGKFLMGMEEFPNDLFNYRTQVESSLLIHGLSPFSTNGDAEGNVVFTLLTQGASSFVPGHPDQILLPLFRTGIEKSVGFDVKTITSTDFSNPQFLQMTADIQFFEGDSNLIARNARLVLNRTSELAPIFQDTLQSLCPNDPGCTDEFLSDILEGDAFISTVEGQDAPLSIDCNDTTGHFQEICNQFGSLNLHFRSSLLFNESNLALFPLEGAWIFTKP